MKRIEGIDTMTFDISPKEFAKDLFNRFFGINGVGYVQAKTSAIMSIDLLIEELDTDLDSERFVYKVNLYESTKKELFKL